MFRKKKSALQSTVREPQLEVPVPEPFPIVPFNLATCTLGDPPTFEEQAAFTAHVKACRTRQEFWDRAPQADWMLDLLRGHALWIPVVPEAQLRSFALRCVEPLQGTNGPAIVELLKAVERRTRGEAALDELEALQRKTQPEVSPGGVQGLPRFNACSAGALAAWHSADLVPYEAAFWTAEFAARHDAFLVVRAHAESWKSPADRGEAWRESWHAALFARDHPEIYRRALSASRTRQADLLRSILPAPFTRVGPPVRGEAYARELQGGHTSFYCDACGPALHGSFRCVIFDIRGYQCSTCGRPLDGLLH